jgi:peptide deformylase
MAVLPIVTGKTSKVLHTKTEDVPTVTKSIRAFIQDMEDTVQAAKGAGLAAPQVGRLERICVALIDGDMSVLINPHILWRSDTTEIAEEGCLSLPDLWLNITRPTDIVLSYVARNGKKREVKLSGFNARVVQHEVDHLDGILITDHKKENSL